MDSLPKARSDVDDVDDWLENSNQSTFWMRGSAGLGKPTLAHKIVNSLQAASRLSTFAFLRDSPVKPHTSTNNGKGIASLHPRATRQAAARIYKASHQLFREYTESYIFKPVHSLSYPLVVVVDLDEWEDH